MLRSTHERRRKSGGQALILITFALFAMAGLIGLAVDLGWSFYVKRQAQAVVDSAASAAIEEALARKPINATFTCPATPDATEIWCQPGRADCGSVDVSSNLYNGCRYALRNGFSTGGLGGHQNVTIQANAVNGGVLPPTAPGINGISYWVTVRATQTIPQLFSAILGNTEGLVAARATAAVVRLALPGSLYALDRSGDCVNGTCGLDIDLQGNATITAPGGVMMASDCNPSSSSADCNGPGPGRWAGTQNGNAAIVSSSVQILGSGQVDSPADFSNPTNGGAGRMFRDPTEGLAQPPVLPTTPIKACGISNGVINAISAVNLGPFNYYAYHLDGVGNAIPDGRPIQLNGNGAVTFSNLGVCPGLLSIGGANQSSSFPSYMFFGGLRVNTNTTFGPGQYVLAGAAPQANGDANPVLSFAQGVTAESSGTGPGYAGNMFISTAPGYPGLSTQVNGLTEITNTAPFLRQGFIELAPQTNTTLNFTGFNKAAGPAELESYNGVLLWQDRRNSTIKYDPDTGKVLGGPPPPSYLASMNSPAITGRHVDDRNSITLNGLIYQPRGAWMDLQGNGNGEINSPQGLQIITGALFNRNVSLNMNAPTMPLVTYVNATIE